MRILAIRGENLASLSERFDIDFEREPLRSAGLFAITGETGAGKSTILDALCLALYDKFPRVMAAGATEGAPDPSGQTLASGDPRVILRRGAGRGFAEADFIARDGLRYRARCDLARARGGAAGRLQNRGRSLWRIDESGAAIETLESGVEPVNARIVDLTDLTFDQFRRTALLAQGDFDAFLRASANERGDLLEKITGAEIYSRLSIRAYEKARDAREAVELLEGRRREIGGLSEDARAALLVEAQEIEARRAALAVERAQIVASLRQIEALALARRRLQEAQFARDAGEQAFAALAEERRTLDALARVEPLRGARQEALKAEVARRDKQAALALADARAAATRQALETIQAEERAADAALAGHKEDVARLLPVWKQAGDLDARIAAETREVDAAGADSTRATQRAEAESAALTKTRAEETAATREADAARKSFEELGPAEPLAERWAEIEDWLEKRAGFVAKRDAETALLRKAEEAFARAGDMRRALDEADGADREAQGAALARIGERSRALEALDAPAVEARLDALARTQELLQSMTRAAREYAAARDKATRTAQDVSTYRDTVQTSSARLEELQQARVRQSVESADAERLGELADAAADREALQFRVALQEGEPCPVCGAHEHPFAQSSGAAQELVETLRARRAAARAALALIDEEIARTGAASTQAQMRCDEALRRQQESQASMLTTEREYAAALAKAPQSGAPAEIVGAVERLDSLLAAGEARREGLRNILSSAQALARDIAQLRKSADQKAAVIDARRRQFDDVETTTREAGEARARADQALKGAMERISSLDRSLAPFLPLAGLAHADLDRDPFGARTRLEGLGQSYAQAETRLAKIEQRRAELAQQIAGLAARAAAAAEQATLAAKTLAGRRAALMALQEERAGLLGGEATAPHRARFEAAQETARQALESLRAVRAEAMTQQAVSAESAAAAALAFQAAQLTEEAARASFAAALAEAEMSAPDALPLLVLPAPDRAALREKVEAAHEALKGAAAALLQRRNDLAEVEAAGVPETPLEELAAREAALAQEIEDALTRLGVLNAQIDQDDRARQRAADLAAEIDAASATRRLWDDINAAIGSREGDRFRRFAQSVTLEQLVALANQRLALLAPRYRLERGGEVASLSLQIIDRDLGDERRSTRSLSGGERFLASLALALALAGLEGRDSFVDTLFIDEGFGALDSATLDVAIDALETLQGQGRKVGVISHVDQLQSRIATKICVERRGGGVSVVRLRAPGVDA